MSTDVFKRLLCATLGAGATAVCAWMAAAAAVQRTTTETDRWLMTSVAVALVVGSHLLPALNRKSRALRAIFAGCIIATLYHHAHYFAAVQEQAGAQRAVTHVTSGGHAQALQAELDALGAVRAVPMVAADLAVASAKSARAEAVAQRCSDKAERCTTAQAAALIAAARVQALQDERGASLRADALRGRIAQEAQALDTRRTRAAQDPVDARIAAAAGVSVESVGLAFSLLQSLLLELVAVYLWALAIPAGGRCNVIHETHVTHAPAQKSKALPLPPPRQWPLLLSRLGAIAGRLIPVVLYQGHNSASTSCRGNPRSLGRGGCQRFAARAGKAEKRAPAPYSTATLI